MKRLNNFLFWWSIGCLAFLEATIIFFLFLICYPAPIQKTEKFILDQICPKPVQHYEYSFGQASYIEEIRITSYIHELNSKLGFELFTFNPTSNNKIYMLPKIDGVYTVSGLFGETIGLTFCTNICCGNNNFTVQFSEREFSNPTKAKLLVWHEFGHIVGLMHDDSHEEIMNSFALDPKEYSQRVENEYLDAVRKKVGLK